MSSIKIIGIGFIFVTLGILLGVGIKTNSVDVSVGSAGNLISEVATSSAVNVSGTAATLFAQNPECSARIISTDAQPLLIAFENSVFVASSTGYGVASTTLVSGREGVIQAASTSVMYDSAVYGCGVVTAITATLAAGVATVVEYR